MKILHSLVGYLVVTALPVHLFAFASPLADFDNDGYVTPTQLENHIDIVLMNHFLGNITEICQTGTARNHSDTAVMKRAPGDIIEARQIEGAASYIPLVIGIVGIVAAVTLSIVVLKDDDPKRAAFTQDTISNVIATYPHLNWVICHSAYSVAFDGVEGTDWGHTHHELVISFFRTIGYDLYWARSGTFNRYGDGGFINWAYNGNILGTDNGGATVHFGVPS